ncbi:type II toxin-antitoxin system RelE/ParE family toxin [Nocardia sp. CS682]|uniref:type II toxin-antitoxin system RelE/ParE family toxin n=1 Tax=Nocardia sp. CS682 TaxID=1047172 RepID=UPI0010750409|nr:type II toxin-antitoxin system RelE/ParE family toxin [Nocardia sp. CS682]QBS42415.1 addiction module toxin RelE [Nocardia sp. CS682]
MDLFEIYLDDEVLEFLDALAIVDLARADTAAGYLAEHGPTLGEPHCRHLGEGVRELRFRLTGDRPTRITYWFPPKTGPLAILLTAFRKTKQVEIKQVARAKQARKVCETEHETTYHTMFETE